jgi:hypothetical protein
LRLGSGRGCRRSGGLSARRRVGIDDGDHLARRHRAAVRLDDFRHRAVGRRGKLEHDLVGLDVDEVLVALDRLARLLVPVDERRLGDGLGELRDLDFDAHGIRFR